MGSPFCSESRGPARVLRIAAPSRRERQAPNLYLPGRSIVVVALAGAVWPPISEPLARPTCGRNRDGHVSAY